MSRSENAASFRTEQSLRFAAIITGVWLASLIGCLSVDWQSLPWWGLIGAVLLRAQFQTGLFIIGHDAMHQVLWPKRRDWNDRVGAVVLALYAALPYRACQDNHRHHHQFSATSMDPDFPSEPGGSAVSWYCQFMTGYLSVKQMTALLMTWSALAAVCWTFTAAPVINVLLFCTLPLLLSSIQLFVFGTYLPHRRQREQCGSRKPDSLDLPMWLSLLTCFHFGYHREHHENPGLAWFELPKVKMAQRLLAAT